MWRSIIKRKDEECHPPPATLPQNFREARVSAPRSSGACPPRPPGGATAPDTLIPLQLRVEYVLRRKGQVNGGRLHLQRSERLRPAACVDRKVGTAKVVVVAPVIGHMFFSTSSYVGHTILVSLKARIASPRKKCQLYLKKRNQGNVRRSPHTVHVASGWASVLRMLRKVSTNCVSP